MSWLRRVDSRPIVIGPWTSEVGFEVLYWEPWLRRWRADTGYAPEQLVVVTRGGAGQWYEAGQHVELYDYISPADLRVLTTARHLRQQSVKQLTVEPWDQALYQMVAARLGLRRYRTLHPSVMYHDLGPWWRDEMSSGRLHERVTYGPLRVPAPPLELALPTDYVVMRWYERPTWPITDETLEWVQRVVDVVSQTVPVVVLSSAVHHDDHIDFPVTPSARVQVLTDWPTRENLAQQAAVIAKARGFVGTYGGLMQLAVRLGKPALGYYLQWKDTAYAHLALTHWLGVAAKIPVWVGRPTDAEWVRQQLVAPLGIPHAIPTRSS